MKKLIIGFLLLITLILSTVNAEVIISSNTTSGIGTQAFTFTTVTNESATAEFNIYSDSGYSTSIYNTVRTTNLTTQSFTISSGANGLIEGGTTYYIQINGTSQSSPTTYTAKNIVTTDDWSITGGARIILNLFAIIFTGAVVIGAILLHFKFSGGASDLKGLIITVVGALIGAIIIVNFVASALIN